MAAFTPLEANTRKPAASADAAERNERATTARQALAVRLALDAGIGHSKRLQIRKHRFEKPRGRLLAFFASRNAIPLRDAGAADVDDAGVEIGDHLPEQRGGDAPFPDERAAGADVRLPRQRVDHAQAVRVRDRKSTRLNSSH